MGRVHRFLGLEVGVILSQMTPEQRRASYNADITYGTNNEFGFDYLRDNMAWTVDEMVQRGHNFAIVDEVDSILIDEARTPLIISGPADQSPKWYADFAKLVRRLAKDEDYEVDIKKRTVGITDAGVVKVEDWLGVENLYETVNTPLVGFLNNAIRAKELFERNKEYVVQNGEVLIVDEHTGRILAGRRYNEGLHQAIEAKENVEIKAENQTLATITLQNFFRMYDKLSGMTGTAMTEAAEFNQIYKLGVVPIPTNKDNVRIDLADSIYRTESAKFGAVVEDLQECQAKGQPVLVGTASVEKSEVLSELLKKAGVRHEVLNAKHHEREAAIVAEAGRKGAVTVATNMAGRGTDIILGGNPELRAAADLAARGLDPVDTPDDYEAAWPDALSKAAESVKTEHEEVVGLGGLYVLATERHESRRIDNQLRGRAARQGDPGTTRFYLSLEDDLMKRFNATMVDAFLTRFNVPDDVPIEAKMVSRAIASAQGQVEAQNFEIRKNVLKYDEVLNRQRQVVYGERQRVLHGENLEDEVRVFLDDTITGAVSNYTGEGYPEEWDLEQLWTELQSLYPVGVAIEAVETEAGGRSGLSTDLLTSVLQDDAQAAYDRRTEELEESVMRELERQVILNVLDRKWREHLYEMDYLQEGIGLRAMAQRDPLVEYQKEGFDLFVAMMNGIKEETVGYMFHVQPTVDEEDDEADDELEEQVETPRISAPGLGDERPRQVQYSSPTLDEEVPAHVERGTIGGGGRDSDPKFANVARNAPCPCGSGKKFKRCHGDPKNAA
jgi:preprotein translocase subunit SecA